MDSRISPLDVVGMQAGDAKILRNAGARVTESYESNILIDATHLTWRTLPVAAVLNSKDDLGQFSELAKAACMNITTGGHIVNRDNEFFAAAKRERQDKGIKPKEAKSE
jgi:hypothetical protein